MWGKIGKRFGKRMLSAALSLVLAVGMLWGSDAVEVKAAEFKCNITLNLSLVGYEGEGTPEFGEVFLRLYDNKYDTSSYVDIELEHMTISGSGTNLQYNYVFGGGIYYAAVWFCRCSGGQEMYLTHMMAAQDDLLASDRNIIRTLNKTIYRISFMDGDRLYYEQYVSHGHYIYTKDNNPIKEQHIFLGWSKEKNSNTIVDYNGIFSNNVIRRSTTYYAVWGCPDEATWSWNSDANNHWKECSCGDKSETAAHMEDEGTITKTPTETEDGVKTYLCKECGYVMRTETLPATGKPAVSGNDPASPAKPDVPDNSQTPAANPSNEAVNQNHTGAAAAASVNNTASNGRNGEPKTGEIPYIEIYATTAMIAGMAYLLFYFRDEERGMSEEEKTELVARLVAWAKKGGYFRRIAALTAIFFLLCYYHSIGKKSYVQWKALYGK